MKTDSYPQIAGYRTSKLQGTNAQIARFADSPFVDFQILSTLARTLHLQGPSIYPGGVGQ